MRDPHLCFKVRAVNLSAFLLPCLQPQGRKGDVFSDLIKRHAVQAMNESWPALFL